MSKIIAPEGFTFDHLIEGMGGTVDRSGLEDDTAVAPEQGDSPEERIDDEPDDVSLEGSSEAPTVRLGHTLMEETERVEDPG